MEELVRAWLEAHVLAERLTDLEREEVMRLVVTGHSAAATSKELGLSEETIRARRKTVYRKLHIDNREALLRAILRYVCARSSKEFYNTSC
jgi:DNA-binding CsgD family transcriptional regulator